MAITKHLCTTCTIDQHYTVMERDIDDWGLCPHCGKLGVIYTVPEHPLNASVLENRATVKFGVPSQKKGRKNAQ